MALYQGAVSSQWQTIFILTFGLYLAALVIEKTGAAITMTSAYPKALNRFRSAVLSLCAIMYIYVFYKTANSQTRLSQSAWITLILATMIGIHTSVQSDPQNDEAADNARLSYQTVCFVLATVFVGMTVIIWQAFPTKPVPQHKAVLLTPVLVVLAFAFWAASLIRQSPGKFLDLNRAAFVSPMLLLGLVTFLFFLLVGFKPLFNGDDLDKFKGLIWPLGLYAALILAVYWQLSTISGAQYATKELMIRKLIGLQNYFHNVYPDDYAKIVESLQTCATQLMSIQSTSTATGKALTALLGSAADTIQQKGLNLDEYFSASNGSTDPSTGTSSMPFNQSTFMSVFASIFVATLLYMLLRTSSFANNLLSSLALLVVAALSGWCAYSNTQVCSFAKMKNLVFCGFNNISEAACDKLDSRTLDVAWVDAAIQQIINGPSTATVSVTVKDGTTANLFEGNLTYNIQDLYAKLDAPPGTLTLITQYVTTFNSVREVANQTNLWAWDSGSTTDLSPRLADSYTLKDLLNILEDTNHFSASLLPLGMSPAYVPAKNKNRPANAYFTLSNTDKSNVRLLPQNNTTGNNFFTLVKNLFTLHEALLAWVPATPVVQDFSYNFNPFQVSLLFQNDNVKVSLSAAHDGYYIQLLQSLVAQYFQHSILKDKSQDSVWNALTQKDSWKDAKQNVYNALQNQYFMEGDDKKKLSPTLSAIDRNVLSGLLNLANSADHKASAPTQADLVDLYLERVYAIFRIRSGFDASQVGNDIQFVENNTILGLEVNTFFCVFCVAACVLLLLRTRLSFSNMLINDYFRTSFLRKQPSAVYNPIFLALVMLCVLYSLYKAYDNYLFESSLVKLASQGTNSMWGGKQTIAPLVLAVACLIAYIPFYYEVLTNRRQAILITLTLLAMLYTPMIHFMKQMTVQQKADKLWQFNTWSIVFVFVVILLKVFSVGPQTGSWWTWQNVLAVVAIGVALVFTSLPATVWDHKSMTNEEYTGKLQQANLGAMIGFGVYAVLLLLYLVVMKRMKIFSNGLKVGAHAAAFNIVA